MRGRQEEDSCGAFAWIPYAAAGVGCLAGGWLSSRLLVAYVPLDRAGKVALGLSAAVMPAVLFIPAVPVGWAPAIFSLAYFGQQSWSTLVMILPTDMYPGAAIGAVAGLVGFGGDSPWLPASAGRMREAGDLPPPPPSG